MTVWQLFFGGRFHLVSLPEVLFVCFRKLFSGRFSCTRGRTVFSNSANKYLRPSANAFYAEFMWAVNASSCLFLIAYAALGNFSPVGGLDLRLFLGHKGCVGFNNIRNAYYCFHIMQWALIHTKIQLSSLSAIHFASLDLAHLIFPFCHPVPNFYFLFSKSRILNIIFITLRGLISF